MRFELLEIPVHVPPHIKNLLVLKVDPETLESGPEELNTVTHDFFCNYYLKTPFVDLLQGEFKDRILC